MANKLTVAQLKKQLNEYSKEDLISIICELYKTIPAAADYLNIKIGNKEYLIVLQAEAKKKVRNEFFPSRGFGRLSLSTAKNAISAFKKVCDDMEMVIDLQLFYVECGVEFTNTYGDINESFYNSIGGMYETVVKTINKADDIKLYETFADRLKAVVNDTSGIGWGFGDYIDESYNSLKWV